MIRQTLFGIGGGALGALAGIALLLLVLLAFQEVDVKSGPGVGGLVWEIGVGLSLLAVVAGATFGVFLGVYLSRKGRPPKSHVPYAPAEGP